MQQKNILFLGFGDLAMRTSTRLIGHRRVGVARSAKPMPAGVELWQGGVSDPAVLARIGAESFDAVVITLTPSQHSDEAYRQSYVAPLEALLPAWQAAPPGLVLFASSTGVYGQVDGSWVDEESPAEPESFSGSRMLEAEALLQAAPVKHVIVRFAGIYGPGRDFLIRQVREGKGGSADFTNRIHADDCAGVIAHLLGRHFSGQSLEPMYLASDDEPVPGSEIRAWLAEQMGLSQAQLKPSEGMRSGSKRCRNHRLRASGYEFIYPSYREGYQFILSQS